MKLDPQARVLLDLRGLVLHAYYAGVADDTIRDPKTGDKVRTSRLGVDNFLRMYLDPILANHAPVNVVAVLEGANHNARRRNMESTYKNKPSQDQDNELVNQQKDEALQIVQKVLLGLGCILVKAPACEADDVIALIVERTPGPKIIYTKDQDLLALHKEGEVAIIVANELKESFKGIDLNLHDPRLVTLYKSFVGDTSDNIPGVSGVGEKSWERLVEDFGYNQLMELYECVDSGKFEKVLEWANENDDKVLAKIHANRNQWRSSFLLAKLHPEWVEQTFAGKQTKLQWAKRLPARERVFNALEPIGLEDWVNSFSNFYPTYELITRDNEKKIPKLVEELKAVPFVPFDYESFDALQHPGFQQAKRSGQYVDVLNQQVTGCSFCYGENFNHSFYISVKHRDTRNCDHETIGKVIEAIHEDHEPHFVAHNATFESVLTQNNFGLVFDEVLDTLVCSSYANENEEDRLKQLSKRYLNYDQQTYLEVVPKGQDMRDISGEEVLKYGCDDAFVTAHLFVLFRLMCEVEGTFDFLCENETFFDTALIPAFIKGIPIDWNRLEQISENDDALNDTTDKEVRNLLIEHCSEINDEGFELLWAEVEPYERAKRENSNEKNDRNNKDGHTTSKGASFKIKSEAEIEQEIEDVKEEYYQACKYIHQTPKEVALAKSGISAIAKAIGLPPIKSLEPDRLEFYVSGISEQFKENEPNAEQNEFIVLLGNCMTTIGEVVRGKGKTSMSEHDIEFIDFLDQVTSNNPAMWDGDELNVGSSKQMAQLFIGKMGLPVLVRNPKQEEGSVRSLFDLEGAPSTNEIAIKTWMAELDEEDWRYQVLNGILTMKGIRQRRSLYYRPYRLWKSPQDDRIHPQFKNCGTITRRPSGTSPNILQVSKTKDDGRMRSCFLPQSNDELIVSIDFVQQELVILAALSGDKNLLSCYGEGQRKDVHSMTATAIMNMLGKKKGRKELTYEDYIALLESGDKEASNIRKKYAKTTNFLIVYGGSAVGLSRKTIVPRAMAEDFVAGFHKMYPGVEDFSERTIKFAKKHGFVQTIFGNRKHCDGLFDKNAGIVASWERQAVNYLIQGCAADIGKKVLKGYVTEDFAERYKATLYALIYDELIGSVPDKNIYEYVDQLANIMEIPLPNGVKLRTSVSIGTNWGEQVELGERPSEAVVELATRKLREGLSAKSVQKLISEAA